MAKKILFIDDELKEWIGTLRYNLESEGFIIEEAETKDKASLFCLI
jgi:hypothetical protein